MDETTAEVTEIIEVSDDELEEVVGGHTAPAWSSPPATAGRRCTACPPGNDGWQ